MTVVVASVAPDGIILASDSRTTQSRGPHHHRVASNAAQKVYNAWDRIGLATYGIATIGNNSIRGVISAWLDTANQKASLDDTAHDLAQYLQARLNKATPATRGKELYDPVWPLGVLLAGYDDTGVGRVLEARVWPRHQQVAETGAATTTPSSMWRGQTMAIRRLIQGIDEEALRALGVKFDEETAKNIKTIAYDLIQPTTLQDAVDLAHFVIETTVQMQRFSDGTYASPMAIPGCGGPTQCLAVTPTKVEWVRQLVLSTPC